MKEDWSWGLWMASKPLCSGDMARNWKSQMENFFSLQYLPSCYPFSAVPSYSPLVSSVPMLRRHSRNRVSCPPRKTTWYPPSILNKIILVPRQVGTALATCHPRPGRKPNWLLSAPSLRRHLQKTACSNFLTKKSDQNS